MTNHSKTARNHFPRDIYWLRSRASWSTLRTSAATPATATATAITELQQPFSRLRRSERQLAHISRAPYISIVVQHQHSSLDRHANGQQPNDFDRYIYLFICCGGASRHQEQHQSKHTYNIHFEAIGPQPLSTLGRAGTTLHLVARCPWTKHLILAISCGQPIGRPHRRRSCAGP